MAMFPLHDMVAEVKPVTTYTFGTDDQEEVQMYRDLVALGLYFTGQVDTPAQADPAAYNPFCMIHRIELYGDGHDRVLDMTGPEMWFYHRLWSDCDPAYTAIPTDEQSDYAVMFNCLLYCPLFKNTYQVVEFRVTWEDEATICPTEGFNVDSGTLYLSAHYGQVDREMKAIHRAEDGAQPTWRVPTIGIFQGAIFLDDEESDANISNVRFTHEGLDHVDDTWMSLKNMTRNNDKTADHAGYIAVLPPPVQPINNTFITIDGTAAKTYSILEIYTRAISITGPRTAQFGPVRRLPLDIPRNVELLLPQVARDLRAGTRYSASNPFVVGANGSPISVPKKTYGRPTGPFLM